MKEKAIRFNACQANVLFLIKLILSGNIFGQYRKFTKQNKTEINLEDSNPLSDEINVAHKEAAIRQR